MEKELNLYQKIKPLEEKLKKAKNNACNIKQRGYNPRIPFYWEHKVEEYQKEIDKIIAEHNERK